MVEGGPGGGGLTAHLGVSLSPHLVTTTSRPTSRPTPFDHHPIIPQEVDTSLTELCTGPAGLHSFGQILIGDVDSPRGVLLVGKREVTEFGRGK
jgi:hypothetical protein